MGAKRPHKSSDEDANEDLSLRIVAKAKAKAKAEATPLPINYKKKKMISDQSPTVAAAETDLAGAQVKDNPGMAELTGSETKEPGENAVMRKLLRGPRYFDPPEEREQVCYNCGECGHVAVHCTVERRKKPCYVCGNVGHGAKDCLQGTECFICKNVGHIARNCTEERSRSDRNNHCLTLCLYCGDIGHEMASCQNGYDPEDLKCIQCYACKSFGHLCCIDIMDSSAREPSCYNCGEKGHTGLGCAKERKGKGNEGPAKTCFRCGEGGHFARGCRRDANFDRWMPDVTTPGNEWSQEDPNVYGFRSVPRNFGLVSQWQDMESNVRRAVTPGDLRYGWETNYEDWTHGEPHMRDSWVSPAGMANFGGWEMGSGSTDHRSTSKNPKNVTPYTSNGSHHSYKLRNRHSSSKTKRGDGWSTPR